MCVTSIALTHSGFCPLNPALSRYYGSSQGLVATPTSTGVEKFQAEATCRADFGNAHLPLIRDGRKSQMGGDGLQGRKVAPTDQICEVGYLVAFTILAISGSRWNATFEEFMKCFHGNIFCQAYLVFGSF